MMPGSMRGYEKFWQRWRAVEEWRKWHKAAYQQSLQYLPSEVISYKTENNDQFNAYYNHSSSLVDPNMDIDENIEDSCNSVSNIEYSSESDSASLTFEVDEDMIAFFEQSMRHKIELRKERLLLQGNSVENISIDDVSQETDEHSENSTSKIRKPRGSKKNTFKIPVPSITADEHEKVHNMSLLYGDAAPKIRGMETAVQLSFERLCDIRKPVHWPCIPFRP